MKKFIAIVLIITTLFLLTSCGETDEDNMDVCFQCGKIGHHNVLMNDELICIDCARAPFEDSYTTNSNQTTDTNCFSEKLSDACDMVLAEGITPNGDVYEVVADQYEDYIGTVIKVGVIKNNEWLREMSSDTPFSDEDGLIFNGKSLDISGKDESGKTVGKYLLPRLVNYIGNGCFLYQEHITRMTDTDNYNIAVWNVETNQFFKDDDTKLMRFKDFVNEEGLFIVATQYGDFDAKLLNTNDMSLTDLHDPLSQLAYEDYQGAGSFKTKVGYEPYSEGLYAIVDYTINDFKDNTEYDYHVVDQSIKKKIGFYDLEGNLVIDLTEYELYDGELASWGDERLHVAFKDGECTFYVRNAQGNIFTVTIDKTGTVINSQAV